MRAAAVVIGDELLTGKVRDVNTQVLARCLFELGVALVRVEVVPDVVEDIVATLRRIAPTVDAVFTSGGIGPTHDDVTYEAVGAAFGRGLEYHAETLAALTAFYARRSGGAGPGDAAKRMALFPVGSRIVPVPGLWAPLVVCENVYILPGVPQLFEAFVRHLPVVLGRHGTIHRRLLYTRQLEVDIADVLRAAATEHFPGVSIGSYPRFGDTGGVAVMISIEGRVEADVVACVAYLERHLRVHVSEELCARSSSL